MSSTVAGPAVVMKKLQNFVVYKKFKPSLHREKNSVFPASALALSTALLIANRTEELRASGGSPTAEGIKIIKPLLSLFMLKWSVII